MSVNFLRLLQKSPDRGDGWKYVSLSVFHLVEKFKYPELLEVDRHENGGGMVRLSERGKIVVEYV